MEMDEKEAEETGTQSDGLHMAQALSFIAPRSRDRNRLKQTQARQKKKSRRRKNLPPSKELAERDEEQNFTGT